MNQDTLSRLLKVLTHEKVRSHSKHVIKTLQQIAAALITIRDRDPIELPPAKELYDLLISIDDSMKDLLSELRIESYWSLTGPLLTQRDCGLYCNDAGTSLVLARHISGMVVEFDRIHPYRPGNFWAKTHRHFLAKWPNRVDRVEVGKDARKGPLLQRVLPNRLYTNGEMVVWVLDTFTKPDYVSDSFVEFKPVFPTISQARQLLLGHFNRDFPYKIDLVEVEEDL